MPTPGDIRDVKQWAALSASEKAARERALEALSLMRAEGLTLAQAARAAGTTPTTVLKYARAALGRDAHGQMIPRPLDHLFRRMRVLVAGDRPQGLDIHSSREASIVSDYWHAVKHFLGTGDTQRIDRFEGIQVAGRRLETDPDAIEFWAHRGELDFEDIYELTT